MDHAEYIADAQEIGSEAEQQPMNIIVDNNEHSRNDLSAEDTFVEHSGSHHSPIKHQDEIELSRQSLHNNDNADKDLQSMDNLNDVENKHHPTNIKPTTKSIDPSIFGNAFTRCIYFACSSFCTVRTENHHCSTTIIIITHKD